MSKAPKYNVPTIPPPPNPVVLRIRSIGISVMLALTLFLASGGVGMDLCGSAGKPATLRRMGCNYGIFVNNLFPQRGNQSWLYLERGNLRANVGLVDLGRADMIRALADSTTNDVFWELAEHEPRVRDLMAGRVTSRQLYQSHDWDDVDAYDNLADLLSRMAAKPADSPGVRLWENILANLRKGQNPVNSRAD